MKPCIKTWLLLRVVITDFVVLVVVAAGHLNAQTYFMVQHSFDPAYNAPSGYDTNRDGADPQGGLILSSNILYGTASGGGSSGMGTVFALNTNGTGFKILHSFTPPTTNNTDGVGPGGGLAISGNMLYGAASGGGGTGGSGTIFAVNTDDTGFKTLYSFTALDYSSSPPTNSDGANPNGGLVLSNNMLYGTTYGGGPGGVGTVFALNTNGTGFKTLYSFNGTNDGSLPAGHLVISGTTLYGTAYSGGTGYAGTVFALNTDGTGFRTLHAFKATDDGAYPSEGGLVLSSNILYGTTPNWGGANGGTLFALNTDGSGFGTLYSFALSPGGTNSGGASPVGGLVVSSNLLYGATAFGGGSAGGTVFALNTDGTSFRSLHSFVPFSDGGRPIGGLLVSGDTLYGAASVAGSGGAGSGTVFSLSPLPQLTLIRSGTNVVFTWLTNVTGFMLQFTTNLVSPATWTNVFPEPAVVNGQNTVTNPILGTRGFYRLSQ
jgi:uncharacterized repeat protein (TIGR03803 family)